MSETNCSTTGFRRITRLRPAGNIKLFGFVLVVILGTALLTWTTRTTWRQLEHLQREHAAVQSESFYLGVTLRSAIRSLNGKLLQFGLTKDPEVRAAFLQEATELQHWIETNRVQLAKVVPLQLTRRMALSSDLELLEAAEQSYREYLSQTSGVLAPGPPPPDLATFEGIYARVQLASHDLLGLCSRLVDVQSKSFSEFLGETQSTLLNHQRLLKLNSVLILGLAAMLAVLVYRGMIAPLRRSLSQSTRIIERQEKLASLGVLASGVAHEIRNPLTAIKFRLFSLKRAAPGLAENEDARIIGDEIQRLERIVKDFLRFARPSEPELAPIPAERILQEVGELLRAQLERNRIRLKAATRGTAWIRADAQQMKQVLINLVQNAADAVGENGLITLGLRNETSELDGRTQPVVIFSVTDTGKGIPASVEARLFDPFFTTKDGGTGLGLAIAARIVEKHGGMLRYETELNHGTSFEIVLPKVEHDSAKLALDRR